MLNFNGVSSSVRNIDFKDTGLKFNFFKVPAEFSSLSGNGVTSLTKIR